MSGKKMVYRSGETRPVLRSGVNRVMLASVLGLICFFLFAGSFLAHAEPPLVLRISNWKTGEIYVEKPVKANAELFFGWVHSLEKIPWNEYFHIASDGNLVLDAITFPAFGAGIPEDKGKTCYVKDGLIHMEDIGQVFPELVWLNSHSATRDILLDNALVARGSSLPHHVRLRLVIKEK